MSDKKRLKKAIKHTNNLPDSFFGKKKAKASDLPKLPKLKKSDVVINPHFGAAMKVCKDFGGETLIDTPMRYLDVGLEVSENPKNPEDYFLMLTVGKGADHQHLMLSKEKAEKLKNLIEKFLKVIPKK